MIYLKLFLTAVFWGGTFIAGRILAQEVQPWRNLLTFQQQPSRPAAPRSCPESTGNTAPTAEIAQLKAQNALQKQQLERLNSLLQAEARKSLQGKHP